MKLKMALPTLGEETGEASWGLTAKKTLTFLRELMSKTDSKRLPVVKTFL